MNHLHARLLLFAHLGSTLFMVGLIWFVQIVHYPLFAGVGFSQFTEYEQQHTSATTWVVAPPMLIEGTTAMLLFRYRIAGVSLTSLMIGMGQLVSIWLSTAFLQVPCHESLAITFDPLIHQQLVGTNWLRTIAWSIRGGLAMKMVWDIFPVTPSASGNLGAQT